MGPRTLLPMLALVAVLAQVGIACAAWCSWPAAPAPTGPVSTVAQPVTAAEHPGVTAAAVTGGASADGSGCAGHEPCHRAPGPADGGSTPDGVLRAASHAGPDLVAPVVVTTTVAGPAGPRPAPAGAASAPAVPVPAVRTPVAFLGVDRN